MLRAAKKIEITITDDTTGEVIFETEDTDIRKSYGDGGSIYPANIEVEFDTMDYNLSNNSKYTVTVKGANLRSGPSTNHRTVFSAYKGNVLTAYAEDGEWLMVKNDAGGFGWIKNTLVAKQ
jgi:uncharacterized protein YgiM (DUF1202 family)